MAPQGGETVSGPLATEAGAVDPAAGPAADDILYFLHIHKTAGSALGQILDAHFAHREICPARVWPELRDLTAEDLAPYRLFRGHFLDFRERLARPPRIITLLRDPVERSLSTYYFIQRNTDHHLHGLSHELSLAEFLHDKRTMQSVANLQTRWILANSRPSRTPHETEARLVAEGVDLVEEAAAFLATLDLVGVAERFDEFVPPLYRLMGWPLREWEAFAAEPVNVTEGRPRLDDLDPSVADRILELTASDRALHQRAEALFDEHLQALAAAGPAPEAPPAPPRERIELHFGDAVPGLGWEGPEVDEADGVGFRWIGPGPSASLFLDLPADRPVTVDVSVLASVGPDVLDSLALQVDGVSVPLRRRRVHGLLSALAPAGAARRVRRPRARFRAVVPPAAAGQAPPGPRHLCLSVAETRKVVRDGEVVDGRRLGVAVEWVTAVASGTRRSVG
jgi:hypothetical protein